MHLHHLVLLSLYYSRNILSPPPTAAPMNALLVVANTVLSAVKDGRNHLNHLSSSFIWQKRKLMWAALPRLHNLTTLPKKMLKFNFGRTYNDHGGGGGDKSTVQWNKWQNPWTLRRSEFWFCFYFSHLCCCMLVISLQIQVACRGKMKEMLSGKFKVPFFLKFCWWKVHGLKTTLVLRLLKV